MRQMNLAVNFIFDDGLIIISIVKSLITKHLYTWAAYYSIALLVLNYACPQLVRAAMPELKVAEISDIWGM